MEHAVVVDNVTKKYGAVEALKGVSLTVPSGELFGIIGPDGRGRLLFSVSSPPCCFPIVGMLRCAVWI